MSSDTAKIEFNTCPDCGASIPIPQGCVGMWDGRKPNGAKAGGGIFKTMCSGCGAHLIAFGDVHDDGGRIRTDVATQPLHWRRDA
jgi:hypothetical protein